jgi:hypothetical protein
MRTNWPLVVNLFFLLLLLITARQQWFARASDGQVQRRSARVQLAIGLAVFAGFVFMRTGLGWFFQQPAFAMFWVAIIALSVMPQQWRQSLRRVIRH